ncbi:polyprenyl synthetase family protein [Streptomyces sp. NPDC050619]|uniref:polyprenyl synthetase family protein n=1 Tax=Streptomyces sp. NPDC050619 TaxID=3157214 RepID=UPI00344A0C09
MSTITDRSVSRQGLRTLFGLDGTRFAESYDPDNRRTDAFADAFLLLPDGSDVRRTALPVENARAERFRLYGEMDLAALRREVDGPYREVCDELAAIPLFGYDDSDLALRHNQAWAEHLGREVWSSSWQHHYAAALLIHVYRRITPPEYQTPAHMRLVYAVATAVDWLTTLTILSDDWMDGALVRNGGPAWHVGHPRSFANDTLILAAQALNVLSSAVPEHHPFKQELHDRAVRQLKHCAHYFAYHAEQDLRRTRVPADGAAPSRVPVDHITLDSYRGIVFSRGTDWIHFIVDMSRMLACYGAEVTDGEALMDYLAGATTAACVIDDVLDDSTGEDIRNGEPTIQLCLAVHKAKGLLGPLADEDAADMLLTLRNRVGVDTDADAGAVRDMYARHGIDELALDYLEAVLDRLLQVRRAALEECGAPGDIPAFMLQWLAIDRDGVTERAEESVDLLSQERFRDLVARLARADEDRADAVRRSATST